MPSKSRGKIIFSISWLLDARFKLWLASALAKESARCTLCSKKNNIGNGGVSNLVSHSNSIKSINCKSIKLQNSDGSYSKICFNKPWETVNENGSDLQNIKRLLLSTQAEISWVIKVVYSQFALSSCLGLSILFQPSVGDYDAIKHLNSKQTKCSHLMNFGLPPYFKDKLSLAIKALPVYIVLFDESMNSVLQEEQMNIHITFWDSENSLVQTRYFDSEFMYCVNQDNLYQSITRSIEDLPETNMNQISTDALNANWAVLRKFIVAREENDEAKLAEIGSCSLHILSGSLNAAVNASDWKVHEVMKAMWKILSDSPALRDIHLKSSIPRESPQRFCVAW